MCKAPVNSSPPTYIQLCTSRLPCRPINSVKSTEAKLNVLVNNTENTENRKVGYLFIV